MTTLSLLDPQAPLASTTLFETALAPTSATGNDRDALVSAAVKGDAAAIDGVLRWIRPLVLRYCRTRVGGQERTFPSADDVAQEVGIAVLTALPCYRDQGRPFLAFVYGIAAHKVADAHRSAASNRAKPVADVPETTDLADGPEAQVMNDEFAERIARLLEAVSDKQREILHLRIVLDLSVEETAEAVGSTAGAVRVAQHRALNRLRDLLTDQVPRRARWRPAALELVHPDDVLARVIDRSALRGLANHERGSPVVIADREEAVSQVWRSCPRRSRCGKGRKL